MIGILLLVLGAVALAVPSFTYFTTERVVDVGFFKIDVSRPHTIIINPIVGGVMLLAGVVLVIAGARRAAP
jgi:UDP-N-acetylmuramyl pentapeptide phosphotransferase/UDP-N-acetylglucosamine-1-phosphate transferase